MADHETLPEIEDDEIRITVIGGVVEGWKSGKNIPAIKVTVCDYDTDGAEDTVKESDGDECVLSEL